MAVLVSVVKNVCCFVESEGGECVKDGRDSQFSNITRYLSSYIAEMEVPEGRILLTEFARSY